MFKQIISRAKTDRVEPYVSVMASGVVFNPASVDEIGEENERAIVFFDKETNRLAFVFMRATMTGSYAFATMPRSRRRRIGLSRFLKKNEVLEKSNGHEFPLKILKEELADFEGSTIFVAHLDGRKSISEIRSANAKKKWDDPKWARKQRRLIREGRQNQQQNQI